MKILVTGGAGFIASHIVDEYIKIGHDVTIIDNLSTGVQENINSKAKFIRADIQDRKTQDIIVDGKFDIISHHAAQMNIRVSVDDPLYDANNNIMGSLNINEAARKGGVKKVIFASSGGAVYGEQDYFPADESHNTNPCSPYGISKLTNEKYLYYYNLAYGLQNVSFRYGNIYGPRQNPHGEAGVVAIFCERMLGGNQPVINGSGENTRDYVYVGDVVKANVLALNDDFNGIYNIGTSIENDVNFIFRTLNQLTGANCQEKHGPAKTGEQKRSVLSYEKIKNQHGWQPTVDFKEGLEKTVDYFKAK